MGYQLEEFIEETNAAESREGAFALYQAALKRLGFDSVVYTFVTDHLAANQRAGHGIQSNYPGDWMTHYHERGYQHIDPVILRVKETAAAFRWRDLIDTGSVSATQRGILEEAADAGLKCGVGIPLYGPRGELAGVGIASNLPDATPDRNTLSALRLLTEQFHLVYCELSAQETAGGSAEEAKQLTPRETEILKWWAVGKTAAEIALILDCSKSNVKWHITRVYEKLEANTRIFAVTKAIRLGYLSLDVVPVV